MNEDKKLFVDQLRKIKNLYLYIKEINPSFGVNIFVENKFVQFHNLIKDQLPLSRSVFEELSNMIFDVSNIVTLKFKTPEASVNKLFTDLYDLLDEDEASIFLDELFIFLDRLLSELRKEKSIIEKNKKKNAAKYKKDDKLFGDYAFPEGRDDIDVIERNTKIESEIENAIIDHFNDNVSISKYHSSILQSVLARGLYNDIIKEPQVQYAFRGMLVNRKWLKAMGVNLEDLNVRTYIDKKFTFKPKRGDSSSWTEEFNIAFKFSKEDYIETRKDFNIAIVLRANVAENKNKFLQSTNGLYNISFIHDEFHKEKEIVGLGPISVEGVTIIPL